MDWTICENISPSNSRPIDLFIDMDGTLGYQMLRELMDNVFDWLNPNQTFLKVVNQDCVFKFRKDISLLKGIPFNIVTANCKEVAYKVANRLLELGYLVGRVFVDTDIHNSMTTGKGLTKKACFVIEDCEYFLEAKLGTMPENSKGVIIHKSTPYEIELEAQRVTLEEALAQYHRLCELYSMRPSTPWSRVRI
jgi:hypothetical protein